MSYYEQNPNLTVMIQNLKDLIKQNTCSSLKQAVEEFRTLRTLYTPSQISNEYFGQLKAQALLSYVREMENGNTTSANMIVDIGNLAIEFVEKDDPQQSLFPQPLPTGPYTDRNLYIQFRTFCEQYPGASPETKTELIEAIKSQYNYDSFVKQFFEHLDGETVLISELQSILPPPVERIRATDLVTVISKELLQAIHKGDDRDLVNFLANHQMLHIIDQKPTVFSSHIPLSAGNQGYYDLLSLSDPSLHPNVKDSAIDSDEGLDGSMKSKTNKRKRPHEPSIDSNKRRTVWVETNSFDESLVSPELTKPLIPMKEIAKSIKNKDSQTTQFVNNVPIVNRARSQAPTPPRAAGTTVTGQRKRKRWTDEEVDFLLEGVKLFGVGSWKDILNHFQFGDRTYVDLKDKFRNLRKHYSLEELTGAEPFKNTT